MHILDWVILAVVIVGVIVALFGWDRYRGNQKTTSSNGKAKPTDEVFIDPETGHRMRVWYDPGTGRRDYRPE
jgi:hypothetical protein